FGLKALMAEARGRYLMFTKILFAICITCISLLVPGAGYVRAQNFVSAKVLASEGQVEIHRNSRGKLRIGNVAFKVEDELRPGDTIITGRSGRLVLGLSDGSQAVIAPKTTVVIQDLSPSPRTLFEIIKGKTRIQIEKLGGRPNPYRVNTPTAVIAVRGTIFDVLVEEDQTQVFVHEGEVAVASLASPDKVVFLSTGQMTRVLFERAPSLPSAFKIGRNDADFRTGGSGSNAGVSQGNGRIATGSPRPDPGRGGPSASGGRGVPPTQGGAQPQTGRGSPKPSAKPSGSGRKP
ncbi:MAG: FecR domain-containing protein, partial [Phycisphaerales bacterium]|nr:FecR domain-containing protein [Phycisphaerales bacterium]